MHNAEEQKACIAQHTAFITLATSKEDFSEPNHVENMLSPNLKMQKHAPYQGYENINNITYIIANK